MKGSDVMSAPKIFESEYKFCLILWENEPIKSPELAEICKEKLGWSKTTTYTVIKRLRDRGVVKSEDTVVTSLISKDAAQMAEIDELMLKKFDGSISAFVAAFSRYQRLTDSEISEIRRIIDEGEK
jgi:predicted transcriptional regulator